MLSILKKRKYLNYSIALIKKSLDILKTKQKNKNKYKFDLNIKKEIKSDTDILIEKFILSNLLKTKLNVISEEAGFISQNNQNLQWVLDPLDGTFNYERKSGPYCISLSLSNSLKPIFGVIGILPENLIIYGGKEFKTFISNKLVKVSNSNKFEKSVLATGFPSRLNYNKKNFNKYNNIISSFAKVRMYGSAAYSLSMLSRGYVDYYFEKNIMFWDVAAGLAILEGSGGRYKLIKSNINNCFEVHANNKKLKFIND